MNRQYSLELLQEAWTNFLQHRGHEVHAPDPPDQVIYVITSHCDGHNSFRWLLFVAEGQTKRLNPSQMRQLVMEIELAKEQGQKPFVVVRFTVPKSKILIKPAHKVLETGRIGSVRGGIPWFE